MLKIRLFDLIEFQLESQQFVDQRNEQDDESSLIYMDEIMRKFKLKMMNTRCVRKEKPFLMNSEFRR